MGASRLANLVGSNKGGTGLKTLAPTSILAVDASQNITFLSPASPGKVIKSLNNLPVTTQGDNIIQVVSASYLASTYITDQLNWTPTGLICTITPFYNTSQIIVMVNQTGVGKLSFTNSWLGLSLWRNSINLGQFAWPLGYTNQANQMSPGTASHTTIDSPGVAGAVTYSTKGLAYGDTAGQVVCQWPISDGSPAPASTIVLMELAN